jgi:hypothetical protein
MVNQFDKDIQSSTTGKTLSQVALGYLMAADIIAHAQVIMFHSVIVTPTS